MPETQGQPSRVHDLPRTCDTSMPASLQLALMLTKIQRDAVYFALQHSFTSQKNPACVKRDAIKLQKREILVMCTSAQGCRPIPETEAALGPSATYLSEMEGPGLGDGEPPAERKGSVRWWGQRGKSPSPLPHCGSPTRSTQGPCRSPALGSPRAYIPSCCQHRSLGCLVPSDAGRARPAPGHG